jgi:hypothetical protein
MSGLMHCTLVLEYNYGKPGTSLGSVWLLNGDGTDDLVSSTPLTSLPGWVRIVGPIDYEVAAVITSNIHQFLEQCGVVVIADAIAD